MLDPWYVTGFCDGDAGFTYSRHSGTTFGINLYFSIRLRSDDRALIMQIRDFFKAGRLYTCKPRSPEIYSGFTKEALYYRVCKISELEKIIQHFDKYPLVGKKAKAYQIWRDMVLLKKKFRKPDLVKLKELALALSNLNSKNPFPKRKN